MNYLKEHPFYKTYEKEIYLFPIEQISKENLSPEAQEVWEYRKELIANGFLKNHKKPFHETLPKIIKNHFTERASRR